MTMNAAPGAQTHRVVYLLVMHLQEDEWFPLPSQYASLEEAQDAYATLMADADYDPDDKVRVVEVTTTTITRDITPPETP